MRFLGVLFLISSLALSLGGCDGAGSDAGTAAPVASVSQQPSATPTATIVASATPIVTIIASPTVVTPSAMPTALPPTATATPIPTQDVPLPTLTPPNTPTPSPTPTPIVVVPGPSVDITTVEVALHPVVGGFDTPVGIANANDGSGRLFVLEKVGRIRVVQDGVLLPTSFLDITDRVGSSQNEQGLLGLAFHPQYASNGAFFVNYTDRQGDTVVARFLASADPAKAESSSEAVLLTLGQPAGNHNGGHLAFGSDGFLYIGMGDGGGAGDRYGNGQNGQTLLGAMLRLDVDRGEPYSIPEDNPFIGNPGVRDEIWAIGLRNPWRYSFDRLTGDLYIADVGQNMYEEINFESAGGPGGRNYGWPIMEGLHCFPVDRPCDQSGLTLPVWEYEHTQGCSVTGGYVYRGQEFPLLKGIYLFGDYCTGRIWGLAPISDGSGQWQVEGLAQTGVQISAFGEDEMGELYLLDMLGGELFKIATRSR